MADDLEQEMHFSIFDSINDCTRSDNNVEYTISVDHAIWFKRSKLRIRPRGLEAKLCTYCLVIMASTDEEHCTSLWAFIKRTQLFQAKTVSKEWTTEAKPVRTNRLWYLTSTKKYR